MTDKELLLSIQRQIQQHLCKHLDQFIKITADDKPFEERICKWCGKVVQTVIH